MTSLPPAPQVKRCDAEVGLTVSSRFDWSADLDVRVPGVGAVSVNLGRDEWRRLRDWFDALDGRAEQAPVVGAATDSGGG